MTRKKSVVSQMKDGIPAQGCRKNPANSEIFSVGTPLEAAMGLTDFLGIWIFGRR